MSTEREPTGEVLRLNPREVVDLAPLGSVQITVFLMMLIAGIFQGYDNQALAYTVTDYAKALGMVPAALAVAFSAGLFGMMVGALLFGRLADRVGRRAAFLGAVSILGVFILVMPLAKSILSCRYSGLFQSSGWEASLRSSRLSSPSLSLRVFVARS